MPTPLTPVRRLLPAIVALAAAQCTAAAFADDTLPGSLSEPLVAPTLALRLDDALAREAAAQAHPDARPAAHADRADDRAKGYGLAGSRWWTVGGAYANDFNSNNDFNVHAAFSQFIADELEFAVEAAGWYFNQAGQDTGGLSGSMVFRWHFLHADDWDWSVFGDAGIGLLGAFDEVPDGGTNFNFLPRAGLGFTKALDPSVSGESRGARLMVGVRYHHISNARIAGDSRNPARDAVMAYAAVVFPF